MELTLEKSEQLAQALELMKFPLNMLDIEYLREVAKQFAEQARWQEGAFILNPYPSFSKLDLLKEEAKALNQLCDYVETLRKIDALKIDVVEEKSSLEKIAKMFF